MFGSNRRDETIERAVEGIAENLRTQLNVYISAGIFNDAIQKDPYIAGYINGKIHSFIAYSIKAYDLNPTDANQVSGRVLLNVFGENDAKVVSDAIKRHSVNSSPHYTQAMNRGALIIAYTVGAQDVSEAFNYEKAIRTADKILQNQDVVYSESESSRAVFGLEEMWFNSRLKELV